MRNLKLTIQYDGTKYRGWQRLSSTSETIQGKIESVLSKMTGEKIQIIGSGRTDAGVHAQNQVANFLTSCDFSTDKILNYCYDYLPEDIVVKNVEEVPERFHARYNVKSKTYTYYICNDKVRDVFTRKYSYHTNHVLDIPAMKEAASYLLGTHDFKSFTNLKSKKKSTIKTIKDITIIKDNSNISISFTGDGFLYNMIRILVGTLLEVGMLNIKPSDVKNILDAKDRVAAGEAVLAKGLFLMNVEY